jgi:L-amino acid N-acyltransferase YncA
MEIRLARESDAEAILSVYAPYIRNTAITFECEVPSPEEFRSRIRNISADYPYLACISDGRLIGYAYAHRQMERSAYQWNAELSVYLDGAHRRRGIGKALYGALLEILRLQNVQNVYGGVTVPNAPSEALHGHFGFTRLGVYHDTGCKCGAWHDVAWFEKSLGSHGSAPKAFVPFRELDPNAVAAILARAGGGLNGDI